MNLNTIRTESEYNLVKLFNEALAENDDIVNGSPFDHGDNESGLSIYREIRVFPRAVGNTGKYREIPGNTGKYREILGNTGKYREIGNQWAHNYGWQALWLGV